jgi:chromosome segregation ATPase
MTAHKREQVEKGIRENLEAARQSRERLCKQKSENYACRSRFEKLMKTLVKLRNYIEHIDIQGVSLQFNVTELEDLLTCYRRSKQERLKDLETEKSNVRNELDRLGKAYAEYLVIKNSLDAQEIDSVQELHTIVVQLERRLLSIRAAEAATTETLAYQRDIGLDEVYAQIAHMWDAFSGHKSGTWNVKLNSAGMTEIIEGERVFDFSQFSGGQKTAFLVMLHTIVSTDSTERSSTLADTHNVPTPS